jgi:hypothetical protein
MKKGDRPLCPLAGALEKPDAVRPGTEKEVCPLFSKMVPGVGLEPTLPLPEKGF